MIRGSCRCSLTCSALTGDGVPKVWGSVNAHRASLTSAGLAVKRAEQQWDLTWALVRDELEIRLRRAPELTVLRDEVLAGRVQAATAADRMIELVG